MMAAGVPLADAISCNSTTPARGCRFSYVDTKFTRSPMWASIGASCVADGDVDCGTPSAADAPAGVGPAE